MHDPVFPQWLKDVQAMPAEKQIEEVGKKLVGDTVGAMYLAGEDCVVQGDLVFLVGIKHGEKEAVQSRSTDVSQKTR